MKNVLGADGIKYSTITECMAAAPNGMQGYELLGDVVEHIQLRCDYDKCATDKDTCHECSRNTNYQDLYKEIE